MFRSVKPVDFTYSTAHSEERDGLAYIEVMPRCECGAKRWFQCRCEREGVKYTGVGIDQTGCACLAFLRAVVSAHPGCDYIMQVYPAHLQATVDEIINARPA